MAPPATSPRTAGPKPFPVWLRWFEPSPSAAEPLTDPVAIQAGYRRWQMRVLVAGIIGYAAFYFVRKNLSVAMPLMEKGLGFSKVDLGLFLTLHGVLYGVSKFANGIFGDRCNAPVFMAFGLAASALLNVFFGCGSTVVMLGCLWMLNGWVQGMGFPPCARLMTHWFPPSQFATKMAVWNTSHSIGAGLVVILCGFLAPFGWRLCFLVPAGIALACAAFLWLRLPDTPPSVGLPEVEGTQVETSKTASDEDFKGFLVEHVFKNPYIWLVAVANFFVYTLRYAVFDWGPTLLMETKHVSITNAGWMMAAFEMAGVAGMLLSGWLSDRLFGGRAIRTSVVYMVFASLAILLLWKGAGQSKLANTALLCVAGFFIYGPQCLVGVAAANLATKRAAATAVGLTGLFGYASTVLSGWGLGVLVQQRGWEAGFAALLIVAILGTLLFAAGWRAKAHGYADR